MRQQAPPAAAATGPHLQRFPAPLPPTPTITNRTIPQHSPPSLRTRAAAPALRLPICRRSSLLHIAVLCCSSVVVGRRCCLGRGVMVCTWRRQRQLYRPMLLVVLKEDAARIAHHHARLLVLAPLQDGQTCGSAVAR